MEKTGKYLNKKTGDFIEFKYRDDLSPVDIQNFAIKVSKILVNNGEYYSALRDLVFDLTLINEFSDVDIDDLINAENQWEVVDDYIKNNTVASEIRIALGEDIINKLNSAVDDSVSYKTGIVKNKLVEEFAVFLSNLNTLISNANMEDISSYIDMANAVKEIENNADGGKL